ncbi:MAG: hypothetical protein NC908_05350, partial [Candidatus Omnitrophica bacterium]|nr:hypothetical protein [Candidatus Omnitrophota bacterium]
MRRYAKIVAILLVFLFSLSLKSLCEDSPETEEFVGEFSGLGVKVPLGNYYFVKAAIMIFGSRWSATPQTEQELEDQVWEQLLLSYEAFRRNITVEDKDLQEEIDKILKNEKVDF